MKTLNEESQASTSLPNPPPTIAEETEDGEGSGSVCDSSSERSVGSSCTSRPQIFRPREQLMLRANSLKKAIRQIIEHAEKGKLWESMNILQGILKVLNFRHILKSRLIAVILFVLGFLVRFLFS